MSSYYRIVSSIKEFTDYVKEEDPTVKIGSFDSGRLSYLAYPNIIVNLDGVMNSGVIKALKLGEFDRYLKEENILYIIGDRGRISYFSQIFNFRFSFNRQLSDYFGLSIYEVR